MKDRKTMEITRRNYEFLVYLVDRELEKHPSEAKRFLREKLQNKIREIVNKQVYEYRKKDTDSGNS